MKDQKSIDQFFRENLEPKKGQFKPAYWDEAEGMLDSYNRKRGFWFRFKYFVVVGALSLIGGAMYLSDFVQSEKSQLSSSDLNQIENQKDKEKDIISTSSNNTESQNFKQQDNLYQKAVVESPSPLNNIASQPNKNEASQNFKKEEKHATPLKTNLKTNENESKNNVQLALLNNSSTNSNLESNNVEKGSNTNKITNPILAENSDQSANESEPNENIMTSESIKDSKLSQNSIDLLISSNLPIESNVDEKETPKFKIFKPTMIQVQMKTMK